MWHNNSKEQFYRLSKKRKKKGLSFSLDDSDFRLCVPQSYECHIRTLFHFTLYFRKAVWTSLAAS